MRNGESALPFPTLLLRCRPGRYRSRFCFCVSPMGTGDQEELVKGAVARPRGPQPGIPAGVGVSGRALTR